MCTTVICLSCALVACQDEPPPAPPAASLQSVELTPASPSLEIGQSVQLSATGLFSDSSRKGLSGAVLWSSSAPELVTVSQEINSRGIVTAMAPGSAVISAREPSSGKVGMVTVTVLPPFPALIAVEPSEGPVAGGTSIVLVGQGFLPGTTVTIGGVPVSALTLESEARMVAITPPGTSGAQDVVVTNPRGSEVLREGFHYRGAPTLTGVEPASGPVYGGTLMTLRGTDLIPGSTISLGGVELLDLVQVDDTTWTGTTPAGVVGPQELVVTSPYGTGTLAGRFSYYDPWEPANTGLYGGYVTALARHPSDPSILYAGTARGGVYRSMNGGQTWTALNNGLTSLDIRSVAIDPSTPSTLYLGTTGGLFKSTNNGASWFVPSPALEFAFIFAVVIDPSRPATMYAAVPNQGVYKTTDAGSTWTPVNLGLGGGLYVRSLVMDPTNPLHLYAGTINGAIFKSTSGGGAWVAVRSGVPESAGDIYSLAIDPQAPDTVYAGTVQGVYKTTDGGFAWDAANTGFGGRFVQALALGSGNSSVVYASSEQGVFKSTNGGASWSNASVGLGEGGVYALLTISGSPDTLYAGLSLGGLFKSTDAGANWTASGTGITGLQIQSLAFTSEPEVAYAGTSTGIFKTADGGANWSEVNQGLNNRQVRVLAVHPVDPKTVYAGTYRGLYKTVNGGASWVNVFGPSSIIDSVSIHPTSPETVFVGTTAGVSKTTDGGASWTVLGGGLPSDLWARAIAISRQNPSTLYVASPDRVFQSTNDGAQWAQVSNGLPAGIEVGEMQVAPGTTDTVYLLSANGGLHKTTNGGTIWENVLTPVNGHSLAIDPTDAQTIYVGTGTDIRKSRDGGQTWKVASARFHAEVETLAVEPGAPMTIFAGTLGRGLYKTTTAGE